MSHTWRGVAQRVGVACAGAGLVFGVVARRRGRPSPANVGAISTDAHDRWSQALALADVGAWEVDLKTGTTRHTPAFARIFGDAGGDRSTWDLDDMLSHVVSDQRDKVRGKLALGANGPVSTVDCEIDVPNGSRRWIEISRTTIFDQWGGPTHLVGTVRDISDRRGAEQQVESLEVDLRRWQGVATVGHLTSAVAHDFNNVLAAVHGWAELLDRDTALAEHSREAVRAIGLAANHGRQLTRQLLDTTQSPNPAEEDVDANEVVRGVASMLQRLLPPGIQLRTQLTARGRVRIDPTHLTQILLNLAINARDAMQVGEIVIATSDGRAGGEATVDIAVSDDGRGIDSSTLERLFQPYVTTKDSSAGTGLGLSIVKGLVERAHGEIVVQSAPGRGARFTVCFPAVPGSAEPRNSRDSVIAERSAAANS